MFPNNWRSITVMVSAHFWEVDCARSSRVCATKKKNKDMSLKNEFQTIYIKIIDVNSADYGI